MRHTSRRMFLRSLFAAGVGVSAAVAVTPQRADAGDLPNVHVYPALEKQAIAYMAGPPHRMTVRETCSNHSYVYVIAVRPGVGEYWFRFNVRLNGRAVELVKPPTRIR